ncbi:hypothetical protein [Xanthomonas maliensis]|uniref:hypothetical protein n=1 Tax=Xanthomonas maliensis TaxID=1321368 RepID=UPI001EE1885E|nr:hypothetical protein [Xanthomonas maliensis]
MAASIGMPGDGSHALQATRVPMLLALPAAALATLGALVASPLAFGLQRQPGAAAIGLALLLVPLVVCGLPLLGLMADSAVVGLLRVRSPAIWQ